MLRFALKAAILALLVVLTNLIVFLLLPTDPDNDSFLAAINDKYDILAATPSPRVIFVGSSEVAFGIDSAKIEEAFDMRVVNLGLHIAIGNRTTLESLRSEIRPGDIIIVSGNVSSSLNLDFYGFNDTAGIHLWMLKYRPSMLQSFNAPYQRWLLVEEYPEFIKLIRQIALASNFSYFYPIASEALDTPYRRNAFNEYGDLVAHLDLPPRPWFTAPPGEFQRIFEDKNIRIASEAPTYYESYHAFAKERGASIYAMWTPSPISTLPPPAVLAAEEQMTSSFVVPMIGMRANYHFPDDHFFDTPPHLNRIGRAARTEQLIQDLSQLIGQPEQED